MAAMSVYAASQQRSGLAALAADTGKALATHLSIYRSAELATCGGQSSRDYSSLSHHRTYRSVYGGSILWAEIYSCLPFLPLPENHTQPSFSYLRQFRYFPTGSQSYNCILLQRMIVPFHGLLWPESFGPSRFRGTMTSADFS